MCRIQGQESIRSVSIRFSRRSTQQRMLESEWDYQFVGPSLTLMEVACGRRRTGLGARYFSSLYPQASRVHEFLFMRLSGLESRAKTAFQLLIIHRFAKVTNHAIFQGEVSSDVIRIGNDENGRDHVARIDEMSVELNPAHARHLNVRDQARRFGDRQRR